MEGDAGPNQRCQLPLREGADGRVVPRECREHPVTRERGESRELDHLQILTRLQPLLLRRSVLSDSVTLWTAAHQAPLSMGFSRQEYWSGLPCPPPGHLLNPGMEPLCPTFLVDSLPSEKPGKPKNTGGGGVVAMSSSRGSSPPRDQTQISHIAAGFFTS